MRMLDGLISSLRHPGRRRQGRMGRDEAIACALMAGRCSSCATQRSPSAQACEAPAPTGSAEGAADQAPSSCGSACDGSFDFIR